MLPETPQKRAVLRAERGPTPITQAEKECFSMSGRKRTTAIQVRVNEQEKRKLERQGRRCGLSLSGYLRRAGAGKQTSAIPSQQFHDLYQQVNSLRQNLGAQPPERTAAKLDELAGQLLAVYSSGETDNGSHEDMAH